MRSKTRVFLTIFVFQMCLFWPLQTYGQVFAVTAVELVAVWWFLRYLRAPRYRIGDGPWKYPFSKWWKP